MKHNSPLSSYLVLLKVKKKETTLQVDQQFRILNSILCG